MRTRRCDRVEPEVARAARKTETGLLTRFDEADARGILILRLTLSHALSEERLKWLGRSLHRLGVFSELGVLKARPMRLHRESSA